MRTDRSRWWQIFAVTAVAIAGAMPALAKDKPKDAGGAALDSGTFGVYSGGRRIATETFSIQQGPEGSVVSSQFKSAQGELVADQSSELQLTPSVELRKYEWKESSPEKVDATVTPADPFLIERYTVDQKQHEQNFLLPNSTSILDDYFFIHRELLAWKYLASACKRDKGPVECPLNQKVQFGTLNPHARSSMPVSMEFAGKEKLNIRGSEHEFSRFVLRCETGDWAFWLDDNFKLVRLVNDGGTEVVRD